ncbi:MAG: hypothetical protein HOV81_31140 [Kofleriaceae bacterium]|nr:hypothetical protein [Kofleriaceae bacterium]
MPVYKLDRFEVRPDARLDAERAMFDYASYVRAELPDTMWTMYRDPHAPTRFTAIAVSRDAAAEARAVAAPGTATFLAAIEPLLVGAIETSASELVTSSDLQRRHRPDAKRARRR